jgi:hypothetical protein
MNLYFPTISVPIVELTRGKRSSRWRKKNEWQGFLTGQGKV